MSTTAHNSLTPTEERRVSLSRGPALILGSVMLAAGLYFQYKSHFFPSLHDFPNGSPADRDDVFFGVFGTNGWTGMGTAIAGGLLLFGAAQHHLAKLMSLIVGIAAGAAAIIAAISGNVLGLAAANAWTELGWGACAVILLVNVLLPSYRRTRPAVSANGAASTRAVAPSAVPAGTTNAPAGTTSVTQD